MYKSVPNTVLIEHILEVQKIVREDFSDDEKTRNMCFDLIRNLEEAALNAAEKSGNVEAVESLRQASKAWWEWVEIFDNTFTRPFRNPAIDPEYCSFENVRARCQRNVDEARAIIRLFRTSPKLASYADVLERDYMS